MVASWRPDIAVQAAFNADPNDPLSIPVWTDLTSGPAVAFLGAGNTKRGRQYELDQNQAAQPGLIFMDPYEYLNASNTASPYFPNVVPYRQFLWQAVWPNTTTGNLLNPAYGANTLYGTGSGGFDPSFEAYTAAAAVPWITAVGATAPVVGTTTPHTGGKDLTWSVASTATVQGVSAVLPCIPGRQYTVSAYVRQSSASTQIITVGNRTILLDDFARTVTSGWGTPDVGGAYTTDGGTAGNYNVTGGLGTLTVATVTSSRKTLVGAGVADSTMVAAVYCSQVVTGAGIDAGLLARYTAPTSFYRGEVTFGTNSLVTVSLVKWIDPTETVLATATTTLRYSAGSGVMLRVAVTGTLLQARTWAIGTTEPTTWNVTATDTALSAAGQVGFYAQSGFGCTNVNPVIGFGSARCVGSVVGTSTTTTGAYVRLTSTFTADQPTHTVQVATVGTAVAGGVLLDDLQHEQAASATVFTTTGPAIYGVFRGSVERWPRSWVPNSAGFLGVCGATGVDSFGPLQRIGLFTEYRQAVLATQPAYYWPCNEAAGSVFGEQSGNNGPPLRRYDSKYGPGTTFNPGTATNIVGDPSGTGVAISTSTGALPPTSIVQTGVGGTPPLVTGGVVPFSVTAALWCQHAVGGTGLSLITTDYTTNVILSYINFFGGPNIALNSAAIDSGGTYRVAFASVADPTVQGAPHLLIYTTTVTTTGITATLWVDGVQVGTVTTAATFAGTITTNLVELGGYIDINGQTANGPVDGVYSHLALWNRVLTAAEIANLTAAGAGYVGELSGTRIARYLGYGWSGPTSIAAGASTMGAATLTAGTAELAACQDVTTTEAGNFWATRDGVTTFTGRNARFLTTTSQWTFGENTAGGEYPYAEGISFGYDPQFLFNSVAVTNATGLNVTVVSPASVRRYYQGSTSQQVNTTNAQAIDRATWIIAANKDPHQRVESIQLDPAAYPTLWPLVLGIEVDQRATVKRRPKAANGGAGLTMSQDYFVESVSHDSVDLEAGVWTVTLLLSPAPPVQPGILDDATYGLLDTTMILAF